MSDTSLGEVFRYKSTSLFIAHLFLFQTIIPLKDIEGEVECITCRLFS